MRVTLAMKGLTDLHVQWISEYLDETHTDYGKTVQQNREKQQGVRKLFLNDNNITELGASYLADALKSNHTVEELYVKSETHFKCSSREPDVNGELTCGIASLEDQVKKHQDIKPITKIELFGPKPFTAHVGRICSPHVHRTVWSQIVRRTCWAHL